MLRYVHWKNRLIVFIREGIIKMTDEYLILKKHWLLGSKSAKIKEDLPMYSIEVINAQFKKMFLSELGVMR